MGVTNILLRSVKPPDTAESSSQSSWTAMAFGLTYQEADSVQSALPDADVARIREIQRPLTHGENFRTTIVIGTEPSFLDVTNMKVDEGRWLSYIDDQRLSNVCVLGARRWPRRCSHSRTRWTRRS